MHKIILKNIFSIWSLMQFFENLWKMRNHRDIKLTITEAKRSVKAKFHTTK